MGIITNITTSVVGCTSGARVARDFSDSCVRCVDAGVYVNSHKSVVDERPLPGSLQHVVQVILQPPVARVPAAALRAVGQRLPQQAEPGSLLPLHRCCCATAGGSGGGGVGGGGRQEPVPDPVHGPGPPGLHISERVVLQSASRRRGLEPESGAVAVVASRHGITSALRWETCRHSHVAPSLSVYLSI